MNEWLVIDEGNPVKVDFLWRAAKLAVETDSFGTHGSRAAFERDRIRDQRLRLAGYEPFRFTRKQILREPAHVRATLAGLHSRAAAR